MAVAVACSIAVAPSLVWAAKGAGDVGDRCLGHCGRSHGLRPAPAQADDQSHGPPVSLAKGVHSTHIFPKFRGQPTARGANVSKALSPFGFPDRNRWGSAFLPGLGSLHLTCTASPLHL